MPSLVDWSGTQPYVNLIRQARPWGTADQLWDGNATFNPVTGWPTNDFGTVIASDSADLGGAYLLYAKAHLSRFSLIRFMEWTNTNDNSDRDWNQTPPINWPMYRNSHHVSWETIHFNGSWTLLEDMRQETRIDTTRMFNTSSPVAQLPRPSPKLKAIEQIINESSIQMNFGILIPSRNNNATNFMAHRVPYSDPDLRNLTINQTFYYPLKILQSPIQKHL